MKSGVESAEEVNNYSEIAKNYVRENNLSGIYSLSGNVDVDTVIKGETLINFAFFNDAKLETIKALIDIGVSLNITDKWLNLTGLGAAVMNNRVDAISEFIVRGADLNLAGCDNLSFLDYCKNGALEGPVLEAVHQALIARVVKVGFIEDWLKEYLKDKHELSLAIEPKMDGNFADETGVLSASYGREISILRDILSNTPSALHMKNNKGYTPFILAAMANRVDCMKLILEHDPQSIQQVTNEGNTALKEAILNNCFAAMRFILQRVPDPILHINSNEAIRLSIELNAEANKGMQVKEYFAKKLPLILESFEHIDANAVSKDCLLILGATGAGKSTLFNYLLGSKLVRENDLVEVSGDEKAYSKIGHGYTPQTDYPCVLDSSSGKTAGLQGVSYCDCPSLNNGKGIAYEVLAKMSCKYLLHYAANIKGLIFTINGYVNLTARELGTKLADFFNGYSDLEHLQEILHSTLFVVTKTRNNETVDVIIDILRKLSEELTKEQSRYQEVLQKETTTEAEKAYQYRMSHTSNLLIIVNFIIANQDHIIIADVLDNGENRTNMLHRLSSFKTVQKKWLFTATYDCAEDYIKTVTTDVADKGALLIENGEQCKKEINELECKLKNLRDSMQAKTSNENAISVFDAANNNRKEHAEQEGKIENCLNKYANTLKEIAGLEKGHYFIEKRAQVREDGNAYVLYKESFPYEKYNLTSLFSGLKVSIKYEQPKHDAKSCLFYNQWGYLNDRMEYIMQFKIKNKYNKKVRDKVAPLKQKLNDLDFEIRGYVQNLVELNNEYKQISNSPYFRQYKPVEDECYDLQMLLYRQLRKLGEIEATLKQNKTLFEVVAKWCAAVGVLGEFVKIYDDYKQKLASNSGDNSLNVKLSSLRLRQ